MQVVLEARSSAPLVVHNERLADPLDDFTIAIAGVSKKRNKTIADHETIARFEFFGSLYTDPALTLDDDGELVNGNKDTGPCAPVLPAWNILRCLQEGAKRHKRGLDVLRGVHPLPPNAELVYDGPRDVEKLWEDGTFSLRKAVGIQRSRTMRTRAIFVDWTFELPVEVDMTVFDLTTLQVCWRDAGVYVGLSEMRPIYGRFTGTISDAGMIAEGERKAA